MLVLNAGSSSLKFALFDGTERRLCGQVEGIGAQPRLIAGTLSEALPAGTRFVAPTLVDEQSLSAINELRELAPLHNGFGLDAIAALRAAFPGLTQVACFDTAFHASVPEVATRFALPQSLHAAGYRRFGFHGLNFEHVTATLAERHGPAAIARLLIFHLGNGCSLCAVREGRSVATTMGYSTLDGLVMGTRCGAIDPGLLIALQRREGLSLEALEALLYRGAGLLALSQVSPDMRERIVGHLGFLGIELDPQRNRSHAPSIAAARSPGAGGRGGLACYGDGIA